MMLLYCLVLVHSIAIAEGLSDFSRRLLSTPNVIINNILDNYNDKIYSKAMRSKLNEIKFDVSTSSDRVLSDADISKMIYSARFSTEIYDTKFEPSAQLTREYWQLYNGSIGDENIENDFAEDILACDAMTEGDVYFRQRVLSLGEDDRPDCVVRFVPHRSQQQLNNQSANSIEGTLWVCVRGTATPFDALANLSWLTITTPVGNLILPTAIARRAQSIFAALMAYTLDIEQEPEELLYSSNNDSTDSNHTRSDNIEKKTLAFKNIVFTGHSLGGAIATALYFYWQSNRPVSLGMPGEVYTFGAPSFLAASPSSQWYTQEKWSIRNRLNRRVFDDPASLPSTFHIPAFNFRQSNSSYQSSNRLKSAVKINDFQGNLDQSSDCDEIASVDTIALAKRVHNVVFQLDPVPRIVGNYPLPGYLQVNSRLRAPPLLTALPFYQALQQTKLAESIRALLDFLRVHVNEVRRHYKPFGRYFLLSNHTASNNAYLLRIQESASPSRSSTVRNETVYKSLPYPVPILDERAIPSESNTDRQDAISSTARAEANSTRTPDNSQRVLTSINKVIRRNNPIAYIVSTAVGMVQRGTLLVRTGNELSNKTDADDSSSVMSVEDCIRHIDDDIRFNEDVTLWDEICESVIKGNQANNHSRVSPVAANDSSSIEEGELFQQSRRNIIKRRLMRNIKARRGEKDVLTLFASSWNDFVFSILHDHSMKHTVASLELIRLQRIKKRRDDEQQRRLIALQNQRLERVRKQFKVTSDK